MKKKVCIISFSPIARDARVLRQIDYLSRLYKLAVIGYGSTPTQYIGNSEIAWHTIQLGENQPKWSRRLNFLLEIISLLIFRLIFFFNHKAYEDWYWKDPRYAEALKDAIENPSDIYHANDWNALPIAAEAAKICKAKLIFDAHEYAPLEWENHLYWKILYPPMIRYWLRKYAGDVDGFVTVNNEIGDRYQREYELHPTIVMNAPRIKIQPVKKPMGPMINLIHHGAAIPDRKLEKMIDVIGLTREGYHLNFMLTGGAHGYIEKLKSMHNKLLPGEYHFTTRLHQIW